MIRSATVKMTFTIKDPDLNDEELEHFTQNLEQRMHELKGLEELESVKRIPDTNSSDQKKKKREVVLYLEK